MGVKMMQMQVYLQDFGAALPAQRAQDQAPLLGQSSLVDSFQPQSAHGVVVVVLPGEHFTVRVVSARKHKVQSALGPFLFPLLSQHVPATLTKLVLKSTLK